MTTENQKQISNNAANLCSQVIGKDPQKACWTLKCSDVEAFILQMMAANGIDGVADAFVNIVKEGNNQGIRVEANVIFDKNSADLNEQGRDRESNNGRRILKIDGLDTLRYQSSKKLVATIKKIAAVNKHGEPITHVKVLKKGKNDVIFLPVNIFRVLGFALDAPVKNYELKIEAAYRLNGNGGDRDGLLFVSKEVKTNQNRNNNKNDMMRNLISSYNNKN